MATFDANPIGTMTTLVITFAAKVNYSQSSIAPSRDTYTGGHSELYKSFGKALSATRPIFIPYTPHPDRMGFHEPEIFVDGEDKFLGNHTGEVYNLHQVSVLMRSRAAAGDYPLSSPRQDMIGHFTATWTDLANGCLANIHQATKERIDNLLVEYFGHPGNRLTDIITQSLHDRLENCLEATRSEISEEMESEALGKSRNENTMTEYKNRVEELYISAFERESGSYASVTDGQAIGFMAGIRAYFEAAYKRFKDNVSNIIELDYVQAFHVGLKDYLIAALQPTNDAFFREIHADWVRSGPPGGSSLTSPRMH